MPITIFAFIYSVTCAYMLGLSTVFALVIWIFDRTSGDDPAQDNGDKVFLLRLIMWLPLLLAGVLAIKAIQHFLEGSST